MRSQIMQSNGGLSLQGNSDIRARKELVLEQDCLFCLGLDFHA